MIPRRGDSSPYSSRENRADTALSVVRLHLIAISVPSVMNIAHVLSFTSLSLLAVVLGCGPGSEGPGAGDATGSGGATSGGAGSAASGGISGSGGWNSGGTNSGGSVSEASGGASSDTGGRSGAGGHASGAGGDVAGGSGGSNSGTGGDSTATGGTGSGGSTSGGARSAGCGMDPDQETGSWVTSSVESGGQRTYDVRLPPGYDASQAYPVILLLHGCGNPTNNVPMDDPAGDDAIIVRGTGSNDGCWQETASGEDLPYIDAFMQDVQDRFCVASDHLFAVGYSSGSWLASTLSCHRGDVYRGIASVAGGEPTGQSGCSGQHGRIFIHDADDTNNRIEWDTPSRDRMLKTNNCGTTTEPFEPSPCVAYQECDTAYPVVWCETSGNGHDRQDGLAKEAFWNFFQRLME